MLNSSDEIDVDLDPVEQYHSYVGTVPILRNKLRNNGKLRICYIP
jgi:hypothetical protein